MGEEIMQRNNMSNHDTNYYIGLDRQYNGTQLDYDESLYGDITAERQKVIVKYYQDKKHYVKRLVDLTEIVCIDKEMPFQRHFKM